MSVVIGTTCTYPSQTGQCGLGQHLCWLRPEGHFMCAFVCRYSSKGGGYYSLGLMGGGGCRSAAAGGGSCSVAECQRHISITQMVATVCVWVWVGGWVCVCVGCGVGWGGGNRMMRDQGQLLWGCCGGLARPHTSTTQMVAAYVCISSHHHNQPA
jgi:hypothetical protein